MKMGNKLKMKDGFTVTKAVICYGSQVVRGIKHDEVELLDFY